MSDIAIAMDTSTTASEQALSVSLGRLFWIAVVLWLASNCFVTVIARFATWEGNATYSRMSDLCRWDCGWYGSIVHKGYDKVPERQNDEVNWPFHPLFPITAYPFFHWGKLKLWTSLVLTSKIELLFAIYGFLLLSSEKVETTNEAVLAGSLVAFNPYVIYAHAGYSEPLYFGLLALAFYFVNRRRWVLSGTMGGLASATRFVGVLFAVSYAIAWLREIRTLPSWRRASLNHILGLLLCPLGAALFTLYLYGHIGDALVQRHAQVARHKAPGNPFQTLWMCFTAHHWPRLWGVMIVIALGLSVWLVTIRKPELGLFLALSVLLPLSTTSWSTPRYIWWEPPFLYAIFRILRTNRPLSLIYTAFASGVAAFMIVEWFSFHSFVV